MGDLTGQRDGGEERQPDEHKSLVGDLSLR